MAYSLTQGRSPAAAGTRAILAASVGNLLEWYDFSVYALFAVYIGANFFPHGNAGADLVKAFLVFGVGFVVRPLGSIVFGIYADKAGRKAALTATILAMACGTLVIAAAPSYAAIGLMAPLLLLAGRLLQGFSAGGEIGSAAAFLVEHAPAAKRGRFTAWLQASMGLSNVLGASVAFAVTAQMPTSDVIRWGWRIPFVVGLSIVPLGIYLRRTLEETPAFRAESGRAQRGRTPSPFVELFRSYWHPLLIGFGISVLWAVAVYVLLIFMPVFLQRALGFTAEQSFGASLVENIVFVGGCFVFGAAADRIGHVRMLGIGATSLLVGVPPLFVWLDASRSMGVLMPVLAALGLMVASFTSVAATVLSGLFPTHLRATGVSLTYNGAFTVFGGFAPAFLTWFPTTSGSAVFAPVWYIELAAVPAVIAIGLRRRQMDHLHGAHPDGGG
ncbi:MAG: major facilitator superfamily 1 [Gammaproteobacteria bacterium]|nr:major facilitator superfamily 1 [Gammaproteobacteria bacterium]